ncbi:zinc-binding dehydrogenase [Alicyclobacillus cycloheptanicus]|uniref:alcohol dehydrogenase n=1 Tax=Alicyclobacillus cycloheptanicus TaxID=1457 RepID=A0ABT9XDZ3_9BACL|nr:alcohol dehydrogenase [Alicyclobacillus cycloheptanicus]MDQ0188512.1 propanol-preferring alcohol dehydrogenase [Alicyclobacillus cycloheptanicus]WDM01199.1 zinc-binding dehydrogenase [Alicyclobacillus cycloheptanicus]
MATMKAVQIPERNGRLEVVERDIPVPAPGQVRLRVEACGVCHGEVVALEGHHPHMQYPRIPGHEVIGVIDLLGDGVTGWTVGERVGVGWNGGHNQVTGLTMDGGYAQYMVAYAEGLARVPEGLSAVEAAPLMCAGVTTFGALKHSTARAGDLVVIQGIGGLGHLAIQFARKAGFHTVAVSRGSQKRELALKLGAHRYIDTESENAAEVLQQMGGAKVILATAPNGQAIAQLFNGLGSNGEMIVVAGSGDAMPLSPVQLLNGRRTVRGWTAGQAKDSEETIRFSVLADIRPMIETFPLEKAQEAFDKMMKADVRFRAVLTM